MTQPTSEIPIAPAEAITAPPRAAPPTRAPGAEQVVNESQVMAAELRRIHDASLADVAPEVREFLAYLRDSLGTVYGEALDRAQRASSLTTKQRQLALRLFALEMHSLAAHSLANHLAAAQASTTGD